MKPKPEALIKEIKSLHESNVEAAQGTAERALTIGIRLHQLKAVLPHGKFEARAEAEIPVSSKCRSNYMRLAEARVVEEQAMLLLAEKCRGGKSVSVTDLKDGKKPSVGFWEGGKSARHADLKVAKTPSGEDLALEQVGIPGPIWEKAEKAVAEMDWLVLPFKVERLVKSLKGKELGMLYRDYGVLREPKHRGTHERTPRDLRAEIDAAGEVDEEAAKQWCSDTLMLLNEEADLLGGQKTAMLQKMENIRLQLGQRIQKILKLRGAKTKGGSL